MEILDKSIRFIIVMLVRKRGESFIILRLTFKFITLAAIGFIIQAILNNNKKKISQVIDFLRV